MARHWHDDVVAAPSALPFMASSIPLPLNLGACTVKHYLLVFPDLALSPNVKRATHIDSITQPRLVNFTQAFVSRVPHMTERCPPARAQK